MHLKTYWRLLIVTFVILVTACPVQAASSAVPSTTRVFDPDIAAPIYVPGPNNIDLQTAFSQVPDNGEIIISAGTYTAPQAGFTYSGQTKSFTVRAATGATVVLSGNNSHRVLYLDNNPQAYLVFEGITFANGSDSSLGIGSGVTVSKSNVTFSKCIFENNRKSVYRSNLSAAGAFIIKGSKVFFIDAIFRNNISEDGGAGLSSRESTVYIHNSQFINNHNISSTLSGVPLGAGAYLVNTVGRITNSRFSGNLSDGHGAALYIIGEWSNPSGSNVIVSNSTFESNQVNRNFAAPEPQSGGAINVEDNSLLKIYNSRFFNNSAWIGGAVNIFRAKTEIYNSVFLGNRATDTASTSGFGGAISFNFYDRPDASSLLIEDTYFQGRYGSVTTVAQFGGGIHAHGNVTSTKPNLTLRRVILNDLDVSGSSGKAALGGALEISGVNFSMEDSLVINCDARSSAGGFGGGMIVYAYTNITIARSAFANNTSDTYGGALSISGAQFSITDSTFYKNEISPGVNETVGNSLGAAIYSGPDVSKNIAVNGSVVNSTFVKNVGLAVFDDDRSPSPINSVVYNNNRFYENTFGSSIYRDSLTSAQTTPGLNSLVVTRASSSTDKAPQNNNQAPSSEPSVTKLFVAPAVVLQSLAAGDSGSSTTSYLGYVWNGTNGRLDGVTLSSNTGAQATTTTGTHTLSDSNTSVGVQLSAGPQPGLNVSLASAQLSWNVTSGAFLFIDANQGLNLPNTSSGSMALPSSDRIYTVYLVTKEGGVIKTVDPRVPLLSAPDKITILIGLNDPDRDGSVPIKNVGGQTLSWSAQTCTPSLIQILTASGSFTSSGAIPFRVLSNKVGAYQAQMNIDAASAGSAQVTIEIVVVDTIYKLRLPVVTR